MTYLPRTVAQETAALIALIGDSGSGGTKGLVPAPSAGDAAAGKFLKADGTWATAGAAAISDGELLANISGSSAAASGNSLTDIFDYILGSTEFQIAQRDDTRWKGYGEFSYSPFVYFGASHTGQTTSVQQGYWAFLGSLIFGTFAITLTAKGSSTGIAGIGLPGLAGAQMSFVGSGLITDYSNLDAGVTTLPFLSIASGASIAVIRKAGAGGITALTSSDFTDTSVVRGFFVHRSAA